MDGATRRPCWKRKRWWPVVGAAWAVAYVLASGPIDYYRFRGVPGSAAVYTLFEPAWWLDSHHHTPLSQYLEWWRHSGVYHLGLERNPPGPLWQSLTWSWRPTWRPKPPEPEPPFVPDPTVNRTHWTPPAPAPVEAARPEGPT